MFLDRKIQYHKDISSTKFTYNVNIFHLKFAMIFFSTKQTESKVHLGKINKNIQEISERNKRSMRRYKS